MSRVAAAVLLFLLQLFLQLFRLPCCCFHEWFFSLLNVRVRYSFGVVLWELLTGREPWAGFKPLQIMHMVAQMGKRLLIPDVLPHGASPSCCNMELTSSPPSHCDHLLQDAPWTYLL